MSGWFAVKRGITSHPIFKGKPERLAIWLWMLDNAAWKDTSHDINGKTVTVRRGQVCASERRIAAEVGVGRQVVRTFIDRLATEAMINPDPTHGRTIITLCNYEKYQAAQPTPNPIPNPAATHDQPTKEQGNNLTREEGSIEPSVRGPSFDQFWAVWPLGKVGKQAAAKAFARLSATHRAEAVSKAVEWADCWRRLHPSANPIHASTYLNAKRWQDEAPGPNVTLFPSNGGPNVSARQDREAAATDALRRRIAYAATTRSPQRADIFGD